MMGARTCRVCGCVEWRACPGGCAWASADRCTACPADAPRVLPVLASHIAPALKPSSRFTWRTVDDRPAVKVIYRSAEFPSLWVSVVAVEGQEISRETWVHPRRVGDDAEAVAAALNALQEAA